MDNFDFDDELFEERKTEKKKDKKKGKIQYAVFAVAFIFLICLGSFVAFNISRSMKEKVGEKDNLESEIGVEDSTVKENSFEMIDDIHLNEKDNTIEGSFRNNGSELKNVEVIIEVRDADGKEIDKLSYTEENVKDGQRVNFSVELSENVEASEVYECSYNIIGTKK